MWSFGGTSRETILSAPSRSTPHPRARLRRDLSAHGLRREADGETLCTEAIQAAIDACAETGGGTEEDRGRTFEENADHHPGWGMNPGPSRWGGAAFRNERPQCVARSTFRCSPCL